MQYKLLDTNKAQGLLVKNAVQVPYLHVGNNIQKAPKYRLPNSPWREYTNKATPCARNTSCLSCVKVESYLFINNLLYNGKERAVVSNNNTKVFTCAHVQFYLIDYSITLLNKVTFTRKFLLNVFKSSYLCFCLFYIKETSII